MKIVIYDYKHESIIAEQTISAWIDELTIILIRDILLFINQNNQHSQYFEVKLCIDYSIVYTDGEPLILFEGDDEC